MIRDGNNIFLGKTLRNFNKFGDKKKSTDLVEFQKSATSPGDKSKIIAMASNQQRVSIQGRILNQSEFISMLQIKCKLEVWLNRGGLFFKN